MTNHITDTIRYATEDPIVSLSAMRWQPDLDRHHPMGENFTPEPTIPEETR